MHVKFWGYLILKHLIRNLQREIKIISKLKHLIILKFFGFSPTNFKKARRPAFITMNWIYCKWIIFSAKITTINLSKIGQNDIIKFSQEINNISQIKHPSILKFIGYSRKDFLGKKRPVIVNEYAMNGTMSGILEQGH